MNNKEEKIQRLNEVIEEFLNSGMSLGDFIKEHIFKEYGETGNEELEEIAREYFLDKLE